MTSPPAERRLAAQPETVRANRTWWDTEAVDYYAEHGAFLGDADFVWGPEGLREAEVHLLGDLAGMRVLEIGAGAGQCGRWVATHGAAVVASDLSAGMLRRGRQIDRGDGRSDPEVWLPLLQCDAAALP
ncbi:methyltransferase domain-containing protein, partial [Lapillicoccus sp.]|uniref:class I SAM-dependent methyltransferase n=1 Tax=Lapillicoccus sp. TaxID=1909287 RepID=UPI003266E957